MAGKRVRLTSDSINCYGTRILTSGIDTSLYEKNPVLLWMHQRGTVVGYLKDIEKTDEEMTAEPVFDMATELSKQLSMQWDFGSLRMVSVSVDIVATSDEKKYLLPGQTRATITKSKLTEVSVVDIGGNDDAIVLMKEGKRIELSADGNCPLPLILQTPKNEQQMDKEKMALLLGLPKDATEDQITARIEELKAANDKMIALTAEIEKMSLAAVETAVDSAIKERRLSADKRGDFVSLGKEIGIEKLGKVLGAMQPSVKLSDMVKSGGENAEGEYKKFSEVPAEKLVELRKDDPEEYKRLYKAEYGHECELDD